MGVSNYIISGADSRVTKTKSKKFVYSTFDIDKKLQILLINNNSCLEIKYLYLETV